MAREIWKLGKFDKGINSYTDPKDIKNNEWAELEDISVSKVGLATVLGSPKSDNSVLPIIVDDIIAGGGLYRFSNDNTYLSLSVTSSYHTLELENTPTAGLPAYGYFGIKSLIWLFDGRPSHARLTFQLTIAGVAIMDAMDVISDGSSGAHALPQRPSGEIYENNGIGGVTEPDTNVFLSDWSDSDTDISDALYAIGGQDKPCWTSIPHRLAMSSDHGGDVTGDAGSTRCSDDDYIQFENYDLSVGKHDPSSNNFFMNSWAFWDDTYNYISEGSNPSPSFNLNYHTLPYSRSYNSDNYPNGSIDFRTHWMMGFYKWDGYHEGVTDEGGGNVAQSKYTSFCVPSDEYNVNMQDVTPNANYHKARMGFLSEMIKKINAYTGGTAANQFKACFVGSECYENQESDLSDWVADNPHLTNNPYDEVYITARASGTYAGVISANIAAPSVTDANLVTSGINLLSSVDRYGQNYGDGVQLQYDDSELDDYNVAGKGMVLTGDTGLITGTASGEYTEYTLTIRGNPSSGETIQLDFLHHDGTESQVQILADYANNELFATAVRDAVNGLTLYTATGSVTQVTGTSDASPPYKFTLKSSSTGNTHFFTVNVTWLDAALNNTSYIGVSDEQMALMSKNNRVVGNLSGVDVKAVSFDLWSTESNTWINEFTNKSINFGITGYDDHLNWFWTNNNDPDPIFYDEGSTLRIAESNFSLLNELYDLFYDNNIEEDADYTSGIMEANPAQWIGYKDISGFFGDAFSLSGTTKGFFIGKVNKVWRYTAGTSLTEGKGLLKTNNTALNGAGVVPSHDEATMQVYTSVYTGGNSGIDWIGTIKIYAVACYDDGSESLPGHKFTTDLTFGATNGVEDGDTFRLQVIFRPSNDIGGKAFNDIRINGIRLYYTHSEENHSTFWNLGKFDFNRGFIKAVTSIDTIDNVTGNEALYQWKDTVDAGLNTQAGASETVTVHNGTDAIIEYLEMPKTESFEDINHFLPDVATTNISYKTACIAGRRTFVGNLRVWNGSNYEYFNDRMVVSPVNALDIFPYPANILDLDISDGDEIIA